MTTNIFAAVQVKSGSLISDPEAQPRQWAEFFEDLSKPAADELDFFRLDQEEQALSFE